MRFVTVVYGQFRYVLAYSKYQKDSHARDSSTDLLCVDSRWPAHVGKVSVNNIELTCNILILVTEPGVVHGSDTSARRAVANDEEARATHLWTEDAEYRVQL